MLEKEGTQLSLKVIIIAAILGWLLAAPIIFDAWKNQDSGCNQVDVDSPKKELSCASQ